jgi:hypothetical protein
MLLGIMLCLAHENPDRLSPPGPLRTVRESLDSYGSHRSKSHQHRCRWPRSWPRLFLLRVGRIEPQAEQRCPFGPVPLQNLQPYYGHLCPCAPHRYSGSRGVCHLSFSLRIGTTGSHVPHRSLIHVHAAYMPDASWVLNRLAPTFIPRYAHSPVSAPSSSFRHVIGRFTFVRLHGSHVMRSLPHLFTQRSPPRLFTPAA